MKHLFLILSSFLYATVTYSFQMPGFNEQAEIAAVQTWYQNNHANAAFLGQTLQPDWTEATVVRPKSDRLLIDIPLTGGTLYTYSATNPAVSLSAPEMRHGATRLVITKFGENYYIPLLLHVFGTPEFASQYGQTAAAVTKPHSIQSNFSGHMVYSRLDGQALYGLFIENGQAKLTLTAGEHDSTLPRCCCVTVESITVYLGDNSWTTYYVDCYLFVLGGGPGGSYGFDPGWWGYTPIEPCSTCSGGGGFTPPICPDGSLMSESGECLCSDGNPIPANGECPQRPCRLTNTYVISSGPYVSSDFIGILPLPWYAFSNVSGLLKNCDTGDATFNTMLAENGTIEGSVELVSANNLVIGAENYSGSKKWKITNFSSATFRVTIVTMFANFSSTEYAEKDMVIFLPYN